MTIRNWNLVNRTLLAVVAALVLLLVAVQLASAQEGSASNETCLVCHGHEGLEMVLASGQVLPVTVDEDMLHASVHGYANLACQDCHSDIEGYPHGDMPVRDHRDLQIYYSQSCGNCHEKQARQQVDNVHARIMAAGVREAAVCADCHGSHGISWINREKNPDVPRTAPMEMCRRCHSAIYDKYRNSIHGQALYAGDPNVPTCVDCHPAHTAEDPRTLEFRLMSPQLCGGCHGDKELMARYGLSTEVFGTYVADFHGTTVILFEKTAPDQPTNKAVCTDCHGAHDIQEASGKESVMKQNLVETCRPCHPDATASFASSWLGHYRPDWTTYPLVTAVTWFYRIFIPALLAFFLIYIALDVQRHIRNRRQGREAQA